MSDSAKLYAEVKSDSALATNREKTAFLGTIAFIAFAVIHLPLKPETQIGLLRIMSLHCTIPNVTIENAMQTLRMMS